MCALRVCTYAHLRKYQTYVYAHLLVERDVRTSGSRSSDEGILPSVSFLMRHPSATKITSCIFSPVYAFLPNKNWSLLSSERRCILWPTRRYWMCSFRSICERYLSSRNHNLYSIFHSYCLQCFLFMIDCILSNTRISFKYWFIFEVRTFAYFSTVYAFFINTHWSLISSEWEFMTYDIVGAFVF